MCFAEERALQEWAMRLRKGSDRPGGLRQNLETTIEPMVRCALRSGIGQPVVVQWVRQHLPLFAPEPERRSDPMRYARPMTRMLCDRLMTWLDPLPARETVLGA